MSLMTERYLERHEQMLKFQEEIFPFTPTIRELMKAWNVGSTSVARNTLHELVDRGLVVTRMCGSAMHYYAVEEPMFGMKLG